MITTVLFDLGVVLVEFDPDRIVSNFSRVVGTEPDEIREIVLGHLKTDLGSGALSPAQFRDAIAMALNCDLTEEEFVPLWSDCFDANEPMMEFFHQIRKTHRTYILSNTDAYHMGWILDKWPELAECDGIALSYEMKLLKPDAEFFDAVIDRFGLTPSQCLYIDDLADNVRAGHAAGFQAVLYEDPQQAISKIGPLLIRARSAGHQGS